MEVVIIGAGPAGLTAGYLLCQNGVPPVVLEADSDYVGGIARTVLYKGYRFDIGGHRFFSKSKEIEDLWTELLPNDLLTRSRSSKIFYKGRFLSYPLKPVEALSKLGPLESLRCALSYVWSRLRPVSNPRTFEDWVSNQFGHRLYSIFFKTYTEKVWGMSCREISADWAAQRIHGLSLSVVIRDALRRTKAAVPSAAVVKSLIGSFRYPRRGPGMLWEACATRIRSMGGQIEMGATVVGCEYVAATRRWRVDYRDASGRTRGISADHVISSAPIRHLIKGLLPAPSPAARAAGDALRYRDFLMVALIVKERDALADNWIYIHDPDVRVGRVQNFKAWSPEMVPDPTTACYGMEYFCFEHDELWSMTDDQLIQLAQRELVAIGLATADELLDGCVVRQPKAYPVYDDDYARHVASVREEVEEKYPNLHLVGRNGMHKYNNQDHSMMTAMLCVRNILAGATVFNVWNVNQDAAYHETVTPHGESGASGLRAVPVRAR